MPGGIEVKSINKRADWPAARRCMTSSGWTRPPANLWNSRSSRTCSRPSSGASAIPRRSRRWWRSRPSCCTRPSRSGATSSLDSDLREGGARQAALGGQGDQTLYSPDGAGGMRGGPGQRGRRRSRLRRTSDLASYVMRLNGVDSMEGLGQDQRKMVGDIVAIGENINRLNAGTPAGKMLTPANLAALSQQVRAGTANFEAIPLANGNVGFAVSHEGARVRVPLSMVPEPSSTDGGGATGRGRSPDAGPGSLRLHPRHRRRAGGIPRSVADAAPRASAREHLSHGVRRQRRGRSWMPRAQLRDAEAVVRQLRVKPLA